MKEGNYQPVTKSINTSSTRFLCRLLRNANRIYYVDSTLLISLSGHAGSLDMTLLLLNSTQYNCKKCMTSKVFFAVKDQSN